MSNNRKLTNDVFSSLNPHPGICEEGELHLWFVDIGSWKARSNPEQLGRLNSWLSKQEMARRDKFHRSEDQLLYSVAHAALRYVLAGYLSTDPLDVEISKQKTGRPFVDGSQLDFSLSHSFDLATIAVICRGQCGVDIELRREMGNVMEMANFSLSLEERAQLVEDQSCSLNQQFLDIWTRKEAYLKMTGEGLAAELAETDTSQFNRGKLLLNRDLEVCENECHTFDWSPDKKYSGAVAINRSVHLARCYELKLASVS